MHIDPVKTRVFKEGDDLAAFVRAHVKRLPERSVLVVASKIVALAEGRTAAPKQRDALIKKTSSVALKTRRAWLTITNGMLMANAGIDDSNAGGKIVLLPKDSFATAARLRKELRKIYKLKKLGVVIADSHVEPLRAGVIAHAVGYVGIKGVRDYRGMKDLFGKKLKMSRTNVADSLATAAALAMGEGAERQPLAIITGAPVQFTERTNKKETHIALKDDLYGALLAKLRRK